MRRLTLLLVLGALALCAPTPANAAWDSHCSTGQLSVPNTNICADAFANWRHWQFRYAEAAYVPLTHWTRYSSGYTCWYNGGWNDQYLKQRCSVVTSWYRVTDYNYRIHMVTTFNIRLGGDAHKLNDSCRTNVVAYPPLPYTSTFPNRGHICPYSSTYGYYLLYNTSRMTGDLDDVAAFDS